MHNRWLMGLALTAVLPFTFLACGDDASNIDEDIQDAANDAADDVATGVEGFDEPETVDLTELNGSGVSGDALMTPEGNDKTRISFELDVAGEDAALTAGIWEGECSAVSGAAAFDLGAVDEGVGTASTDTSLQKIKEGNYVLAVMDGTTVAACGGI